VRAVLAEDMPVLSVHAYKAVVGEVGANPAAAGVLAVVLSPARRGGCCWAALLWARRRLATRGAARRRRLARVARPARRQRLLLLGVVRLALVPFFAVVMLSFVRRGPVLTGEFGSTISRSCFSARPPLRPLFNTLLLAERGGDRRDVLGVRSAMS